MSTRQSRNQMHNHSQQSKRCSTSATSAPDACTYFKTDTFTVETDCFDMFELANTETFHPLEAELFIHPYVTSQMTLDSALKSTKPSGKMIKALAKQATSSINDESQSNFCTRVAQDQSNMSDPCVVSQAQSEPELTKKWQKEVYQDLRSLLTKSQPAAQFMNRQDSKEVANLIKSEQHLASAECDRGILDNKLGVSNNQGNSVENAANGLEAGEKFIARQIDRGRISKFTSSFLNPWRAMKSARELKSLLQKAGPQSDVKAVHRNQDKIGWYKREASKMRFARILAAILVHQLPFACAEEESILLDAEVNEIKLWGPDLWLPGNDLIGRGFKNFIQYYSINDDVDSAEFQIFLDEPAAPKTAFIINDCLLDTWRYLVGSSELRVGFDQTQFSKNNQLVASGITDGGFQTMQLASGNVVNFRRNGPEPHSGSSYMVLNEMKLYETVNLLQEQQGNIQITSNTSTSLVGYEPINLLQNLANRSCGGEQQSGIISPWKGSKSSGSAQHLVQKTCFKATQDELRSQDHRFIFGIKFENPQFIHAIVLAQDMFANHFTDFVPATKLFQNYSIFIGNEEDYTKNQVCSGSPFQQFDDEQSYTYSLYSDYFNEDRYGHGKGMIWPFGAEHWCNLEGAYLHIVSDMSHLSDQNYETSICSLGVIGTRYVRGGDPLPSKIFLVKGDTKSFVLEDIYSYLEIGTKLSIAVREKNGLNWVKITNQESFTRIAIDTKDLALDESYEVVLESFNSLSNVKSALKIDTMIVWIISQPVQLASEPSPFEAIAGRVTRHQLPELQGTYSISVDLRPKNAEFSDFISYDREANQIIYNPKDNDGQQLGKFAGAQTMEVLLTDEKGNSKSYVMGFTFTVPLMFKQDLPSMNIIVGEMNSVALPELSVHQGYQLSYTIVYQQELHVLRNFIYDPHTRAVFYNPSGQNVYQEDYPDVLQIKLFDTDQFTYSYNMRLITTMPSLYFSEQMSHFELLNGETTTYSFPDVVISEGHELKDIILATKNSELAEYFKISVGSRTISYLAPKVCSSSIEAFLDLKSIQIKLVDNFGNEYIYDLKLDIRDDTCESPGVLVTPKSFKNFIHTYTLTTGAEEFTFPQFTTGSTCCHVKYTYQASREIRYSIVQKWNKKLRTFTFESEDLSLIGNDRYRTYQDYSLTIIAWPSSFDESKMEVPFTLRVMNPCSKNDQLSGIEGLIECPCRPVPETPDWMNNIRDITIHGDQLSDYILVPLGEPKGSELVTIDLSYASKFTTYIEETNTLRLQNVSLEDAGDYTLFLQAYQNQAAKCAAKLYLRISITDDESIKPQPSFSNELTPFDLIIGTSSDKALPSMLEGLNGLEEFTIEFDEMLQGQFDYDKESASIEYIPQQGIDQRAGSFITSINLVDTKGITYVYEIQTNLTSPDSQDDLSTSLILVMVVSIVGTIVIIGLFKRAYLCRKKKQDQIYKPPYTKEEEIGQGPNSIVHRININGKPYALKTYKRTDQEFLALVEEDIDLMRRLENYKRILNYDENLSIQFSETGHPLEQTEKCIVMELIDGESLKNYIGRLSRKDKIPLNDIAEMAIQMLEGLKFIHTDNEKNVHRDISTKNIFRTKHGNMILGDPGLAKQVANLALMTNVEKVKADHDQRNDVVSLGEVIHDLCDFLPSHYHDQDQIPHGYYEKFDQIVRRMRTKEEDQNLTAKQALEELMLLKRSLDLHAGNQAAQTDIDSARPLETDQNDVIQTYLAGEERKLSQPRLSVPQMLINSSHMNQTQTDKY